MVARSDVMRSDRLKQVMQELDANFDEAGMGFSKFSKFLAEASSRGLVKLKKLENGQYEVGPMRGRGRRPAATSNSRESHTRRGGGRGRRDRVDRDTPEEGSGSADASEASDDPLQDAYSLLRAALEDLRAAGRESVRDSDVKRKMLQRDRSFDEAELGFPKFSKFLAQAAEHGIIEAERTDRGNFQVSLVTGAAEVAVADEDPRGLESQAAADDVPDAESASEPVAESSEPRIVEVLPSDLADLGLRLGPRRGSTRRRGAEDQPLLFEGQAFAASSPAPYVAPDEATEDAPVEAASPQVAETAAAGEVDLGSLGLPSEPDAIVRYLAHRYKGVGDKTAETLVERFGPDLFRTLRDDPAAISAAVPPARAEQVLEAWRADYSRRTAGESDGGGSESGRGGRRGGRGRVSRSRS
ncbi:MAG TPA: hypothetical protein DC060_19340 [Gemmatimonadetes bacterium]|nr:hypothetical protein [Gemmatimonadota bacterium]